MTHNVMNRRDFIKGTAAAMSAVAIPGIGHAMSGGGKSRPIGLQLYTLRSIMQDDFIGTITKVAEMGYGAVEFAGYGGLNAQEMTTLLGDLGLVVAGTHESYQNLVDRHEEIYEYNLAIGNRYIVVPSMPGEFRGGGADSYREFGEKLTWYGAKATDVGLQLCYHNHSFEFEKANGKYLMDHLLQSADADLVKVELDTCWAYRAGVDTPGYIKRYADRMPMLHIKDMADMEGNTLTPVGEGMVPVQDIVNAGEDVGSEWFVVEQDRTTRPPLEAVALSLKNLRAMLG